jgi:predicted DNA-binding transcriptional regulator AlpA
MPDSSYRGSTADPDHLWTAQETADFLRIPKATLYQWRYLGVGPKPGRVGRHLRYDPDDVKKWFRQQQEAR